MNRYRSMVLAGLLVGAVLLCACTGRSAPAGHDQSPATTTAPEGPDGSHVRLRGTTVFALLADNQLVAVSVGRGVLEGSVRLASPPREVLETTHAMAVSADGRRLYVLVGLAGGGADHVAVVDTSSLVVRASYGLEASTTYRALVLGQRSGRLYLLGNRPDQHGGVSVWATILDSSSGGIIASQQVHPAGGRDWVVYSASVSPDEQRMLVSYHGSDTSGADVFRIAGDGLAGCGTTRAAEGLGCLTEVHGLAVDTGALVIATDGHQVLELSDGGTVLRRWDPGLPGNHVTEFARGDGALLYVVGSCGYTGGMSLLDLHGGQSRVLVPARRADPSGSATPSTMTVCGQRAEVAPAGVLAVGRIERAVPRLGPEGSVLLVDAATGRVRRTVVTPAEPLDLVVASGLG
jgi:hypothetical protein